MNLSSDSDGVGKALVVNIKEKRAGIDSGSTRFTILQTCSTSVLKKLTVHGGEGREEGTCFIPRFFGLPVGFLIDRERKQRHELEKSRYLAGLGQAGAALVHDIKIRSITIRGFASRMEQGKAMDSDTLPVHSIL